MPVSSEKLSANIKVEPFDFDPNVDTAVDVSWEDFKNYSRGMAIFFRTVGTGNLDGFKILANPASDGSGTDVTIKTHAIGSQPNAVGDYIFLEWTADEIAQIDTAGTARYVSAQCEFATSTDEAVVVYIFGGPRIAAGDLTPEYVS